MTGVKFVTFAVPEASKVIYPPLYIRSGGGPVRDAVRVPTPQEMGADEDGYWSDGKRWAWVDGAKVRLGGPKKLAYTFPTEAEAWWFIYECQTAEAFGLKEGEAL
jgi:hypothetical protein